MDPLSRIPKRQDLPEDPSLYELAKSIAPNVVRELEEPVREVRDTGKLLYNVAMGEDAEGLPLGTEFIPGVSLIAKLKQGKTPGLFDILDVPSFKGLTGLKTLGAMAPIATTLREFQQGKRMGKSLRNIEKAKDARKYVTRYHATRPQYVENIKSEGLRSDTPNYMKNTFFELSEPGVWLAGVPDPPVSGSEVFEVKIPRDEYFSSKRSYYDHPGSLVMETVDAGPPVKNSYEDNVFVEKMHKNIPASQVKYIGGRKRGTYIPYPSRSANRLLDDYDRVSDTESIRAGVNLDDLRDLPVQEKYDFINFQRQKLKEIIDDLKATGYESNYSGGVTEDGILAQEALRQSHGVFIPYWKFGSLPREYDDFSLDKLVDFVTPGRKGLISSLPEAERADAEKVASKYFTRSDK